MKLKLIKGVVVQGHPGLAVGDVFECKDGAGDLVSAGYAVPFVAPAVDESVQVREPEIENRDEALRPKRTRSKLA